MDLVHIIQAEHRQVERLFERFEGAVRSGDQREQATVARQVVRDLSLHAAVEEQVLYPALVRAGAAAERLDALEDHHAVKVALSEIEAMRPGQERFAAKVRVVEKSVRRHVEEEESTLLPRLRERLEDHELQRLGAEFEALRRSAPTRPHPASPDTPPANLLANAAASLVDRLRDALDEAADLVRDVAQQLLRRAIRLGREVAGRVRQNGKGLVERARARGEQALQQARVRGAEVVEGTTEQAPEVPGRIEHRTAVASRELSGGLRRAGPRARRRQRRR
jgi:hemerythrin superfamily protein